MDLISVHDELYYHHGVNFYDPVTLLRVHSLEQNSVDWYRVVYALNQESIILFTSNPVYFKIDREFAIAVTQANPLRLKFLLDIGFTEPAEPISFQLPDLNRITPERLFPLPIPDFDERVMFELKKDNNAHENEFLTYISLMAINPVVELIELGGAPAYVVNGRDVYNSIDLLRIPDQTLLDKLQGSSLGSYIHEVSQMSIVINNLVGPNQRHGVYLEVNDGIFAIIINEEEVCLTFGAAFLADDIVRNLGSFAIPVLPVISGANALASSSFSLPPIYWELQSLFRSGDPISSHTGLMTKLDVDVEKPLTPPEHPETLTVSLTRESVEEMLRHLYGLPATLPKFIMIEETQVPFISYQEACHLLNSGEITSFEIPPLLQPWAGPLGTKNRVILLIGKGYKYLVRGQVVMGKLGPSK